MIKNKHHIVTEIESLANNFNLEYQSVSNEIKIYLDEYKLRKLNQYILFEIMKRLEKHIIPDLRNIVIEYYI